MNNCQTELLAMFHEDGRHTGAPVSRDEAHRCGILHGASHTYIYKREQGQLMLLLQRRSLCKDSFPGCLDTSSAGHVDFGSDFLQTAHRELKEELGIDAELQELFTQRISCESVFHGQPFLDQEINKVYGLNACVTPDDLVLQESEVSEVVWMSAAEILRRVENNDPEICIQPQELIQLIDALMQ